jgi:hypothetical protein
MTELTLETLRAELFPLGGEIANLVDSVAIIARNLDFQRLPTEQPATDIMRADIDKLMMSYLRFSARLADIEERLRRLEKEQH